MKEVIISSIQQFIDGLQSQLPAKYQAFAGVFLFTVLIAVYALLIWKFCGFLARRNVIRLNLHQYNTSEHHILKHVNKVLLFVAEYIIIVPILIFFWFIVLGFFLLIFSKSQSVNQILLISAAIIGAVRITSYFSEELSKDLAKLFPFTILAVFLLQPNFFRLDELLSRFTEIPLYLDNIFIYFILIVAIEIILRFLFLFIDLITGHEEEEEK